MLVDRYDPEDVFARVPEVATQTDPVLKRCKSFDYVSENLAIPRAAKRAREKRNNKWKVRYNISHGSIGSFFCFPVRSRNDQIFVHLIPKFTHQQLDPDANHMAAFTAKDPSDRDAFMAHWSRILGDETITIQTILFDGQVAGSVLSYVDEDGQLEVSYWIGKPYWGKGVATRALSAFLKHIEVCPLYARAAKDNIGSLRVLEKCGFARIGEDKGFANARSEEIEEFMLRLD